MSQDGYNKLLADLRELEGKRPDIIRAIAEARDKGDLSENAEYDAAKEAQGLLEMKINELKMVIAEAKIIDTSKLSADSVQVLTKVGLKNVKTGAVMQYTIVPESEANLREGKISINTPIAKGLLGKKVGDVAEIKAIQGLFGEHAYEMNISSTKSMTGHLLGATAAVEAIACVMAIDKGVIPPTINVENVDPQIDPKLNLTIGVAQQREVRAAMSNTFGFGGHNSTLILRKI
jgi:transcription elongation factor GreA